MNSNAKGKRMEREAAAALRLALGVDARRAQQFAGTNGDADLITELDGVHFECKSRKTIGALRFFEQAADDADAAGSGAIPTVLLREDGDTDWYVLLRLADARAFAAKVGAV